MESNCCDNTTPVTKDGVVICSQCYSLLDELEFEGLVFDFKCSDRQRERKFIKVVMEQDFPWYVRETLLDSFKRIHSHFLDCDDKKNFININQLIITLLKLWKYDVPCNLKSLKSKTRVKAVEKFVCSAYGFKDLDVNVSSRLEDQGMLQELKVSDDWKLDPRVPVSVINKIYC